MFRFSRPPKPSDSEVAGPGLKVTTAGLRTYILQYRFGARARRYTIGGLGWPWTPETARDRTRVLQGQIAAGVDPQEEKAANLRALTVAQLCDLVPGRGPGHPQEWGGGDRPLADRGPHQAAAGNPERSGRSPVRLGPSRL